MTAALNSEYRKKRAHIKKRLDDFKTVWNWPDRKIFSELCFCICTPQSKAVYCDKAVTGLEKSGALFSGNLSEIRKGLAGVRFPNNKAGYILYTRKLFSHKGRIRIKERIDPENITATRQWLFHNVKGIGMKETSHFLRNIGFGENLAILDVHILKNMVRHGIIKEVPKSISTSKYMDLEEKLRKFCAKVSIPMGEIDLLFWSKETGQVFK
ncbi:MAG: N-glycosylase/DNA lyase [Candidatus Omnitrophica bacterium]|nr:N-glycosylase/DNA lyase [Candidatus Omnitrophota bacterium]